MSLKTKLILDKLAELMERDASCIDDLAALCNGEAVVVLRGDPRRDKWGFTRLRVGESILFQEATRSEQVSNKTRYARINHGMSFQCNKERDGIRVTRTA